MSRTTSRTLAAVLNLSLVGSLACAGTRSPDDIAPTIRVGMYDLEVPTLAMEAFLVVNEPTEAYVRDTLWVHHGDVFECSPLLRRGRSDCGGFTLRLTDSSIIATYRDCQSRETGVTRTIRDATTGEVRDETTFKQTTDCWDVDVKVTKRTPGGG